MIGGVVLLHSGIQISSPVSPFRTSSVQCVPTAGVKSISFWSLNFIVASCPSMGQGFLFSSLTLVYHCYGLFCLATHEGGCHDI